MADPPYSSRVRLVAGRVGPNTEPTTFTFSHNLWYAVDAPSESTPMLPVTEDGSVIGQGTAYVKLTNALEPPETHICGGPEYGAAIELSEVDGTLYGECRHGLHTIGPLLAASCTI